MNKPTPPETQPEQAPFNRYARIRSRRSAVQALYQWSMSSASIETVIDEFIQQPKALKRIDTAYFKKLLLGIAAQRSALDKQLLPLLDRKLEALEPVERAILHIGLYELNNHTEIPHRVILNEAIELAKMFGAAESHKYINGVLDQVLKASRATAMGPPNVGIRI